MAKAVPKSLVWDFNADNLRGRQYIDDLNFIKNNLDVDNVMLSATAGIRLKDRRQCHGFIKEITEYAHKIGLTISLHLYAYDGFYNALPFTTGEENSVAEARAQLFPIPDPKKASAIVSDIELVADENGCARYVFRPAWARPKIMPIGCELVKAFSFERATEGFYKPGTLVDITDKIEIIDNKPDLMEFEINLGKKNCKRNIFVLLAQYYNHTAVADVWEEYKELIDNYSDIPLDGVALDEFGYMFLNTADISSGKVQPFRGRHYSRGMKRFYEDTLNIDLDQLLFDMRYAPENDEMVRIRAINTYFEALRVFPQAVEERVYDYAKKVFGEDTYMQCHNTFHNQLENDEIWRTACNWWGIPRDFGQTDENICFPVRWGLMLACKNPITVDMYYSLREEDIYNHIIDGAAYNCRQCHHSYSSGFWGIGYHEPKFLETIRLLDKKISLLDGFQTHYPRMDVLVVYGAAAQNNWYPNYEERNEWDINGTLHVMQKCEELWNSGCRCALVPDYSVENGRLVICNDKVMYNGFEFSHMLFLYPQYAKRVTYDFLNQAYENGVNVAVVGKYGIDFNGNKVELSAPHYDTFDLKISEELSFPKSAIEGGCVYEDGSFSLVSNGLLTRNERKFDFCLDGKRICGKHTGILAYRGTECAFATVGSELYVDGGRIDLKFMD